jgi:hypothetical protein
VERKSLSEGALPVLFTGETPDKAALENLIRLSFYSISKHQPMCVKEAMALCPLNG